MAFGRGDLPKPSAYGTSDGPLPESTPVSKPIPSTATTQRTAWILLLLTCLFWSGNVVASRSAVGELSPMALVTIRWGLVSVVMLAVAWRSFLRDLPVLLAHWLPVTLMGLCGFTAYQALYFGAAHATTGVNLAILQGVAPVFVFAGARIFYKTPIGLVRGTGLLLTLLGIAVVATRGHVLSLASIELNGGDAAMLLASSLYAAYTVALRQRPPVSSLSFFTALSIVATLTSLPLFGWEVASGALQWPTTKGWVVLAYVVIFPSLLAQVFFIRGVEMIGPGRASLFYNLVPVIGAIMAVTLLGEPFALYHAAGLMLAIGGIALAEIWGRRKA
ncbi:MAG: EamA family transporter [Hyphomicrobiales bacterium]|nr:EamA family transporter [Hyphomicrobiales bacterium]